VAPVVAALVYLALVLPLVPRAVHTPTHVGRLTVVNGTTYGVTVDGGGVPFGALGPGTTARFLEVADLGDQWQLVFSANGRAVERTVSRSALARSGWRVEVPAELGRQLEAAGEAPTPSS
jgi:hypothetical protein